LPLSLPLVFAVILSEAKDPKPSTNPYRPDLFNQQIQALPPQISPNPVKPPNQENPRQSTGIAWRTSSANPLYWIQRIKKAPAPAGAFPYHKEAKPFSKTNLPVTPLR